MKKYMNEKIGTEEEAEIHESRPRLISVRGREEVTAFQRANGWRLETSSMQAMLDASDE